MNPDAQGCYLCGKFLGFADAVAMASNSEPVHRRCLEGLRNDVSPDRARFDSTWEAVTESGCWLWLGSTKGGGYGRFRLRGASLRAHRAAWELYRGPIPIGVCVLHRCDVRVCVNPDHLWLGTVRDNNLDAIRKGRARPFGQKATGGNR